MCVCQHISQQLVIENQSDEYSEVIYKDCVTDLGNDIIKNKIDEFTFVNRDREVFFVQFYRSVTLVADVPFIFKLPRILNLKSRLTF